MQFIGQGRNILGKTVEEAIPEVVEQGFIQLLDNVYQTGEPLIGNEILLKLIKKVPASWKILLSILCTSLTKMLPVRFRVFWYMR